MISETFEKRTWNENARKVTNFTVLYINDLVLSHVELPTEQYNRLLDKHASIIWQLS